MSFFKDILSGGLPALLDFPSAQPGPPPPPQTGFRPVAFVEQVPPRPEPEDDLANQSVAPTPIYQSPILWAGVGLAALLVVVLAVKS